MPILSANWAELLDPIVRNYFNLGFARRASNIPILYNVQGSSRAYEEVVGVGAIGTDSWETYEEAGRVAEVDFDKGYKKRFTHREYGVDLGIESKLVEDAQNAQVIQLAMKLGDSAAVKREIDAASVFNNATSASFPGSDGVALGSNSHPHSEAKSGTTQDNLFAAMALTKANVATVREAVMAFTDDNNNKVAVTPNLLLVPPALEDEALEISKSLLDPASANNAINPQAGRFQVLPWHYLTSNTSWFMIDTTLAKMHLDWFNRAPVIIRPRDGDDTRFKAYWRASMRYSYGFSDWRWVGVCTA